MITSWSFNARWVYYYRSKIVLKWLIKSKKSETCRWRILSFMSKATMPYWSNYVFVILYLVTMVIIYTKPTNEANNSSEIDCSKDCARKVVLHLQFQCSWSWPYGDVICWTDHWNLCHHTYWGNCSRSAWDSIKEDTAMTNTQELGSG
jgi:hypothetical protein